MAEIAALGIKVEGVEGVERARDSLGRFQKSADGAEKGSEKLGQSSKKAGQGLSEAAKRAGLLDSALTKAGRSILTTVTQLGLMTAAALGLRSTVTTLAGFEQSMASVGAITRASTEDMMAMRDVAKQLGSSTEFSASQAADGFMYLGLAGWNAQQSIAAMPSVLNLATAASLGLADAANISSNIMSAYSIAAEDASNVTDILAGVSSRANTDVAQLGEAMRYVGPVAASLGISMGDTAAALGVLADNSIQGSMGGTALRTVMTNLIKPTDDAQKTLKAMGISLADINPTTNEFADIIQKLADKSITAEQAVRIFGLEGSSAVLALAASQPKLASLTDETKRMNDEAQRMADIMRDTLQGDLNGFSSALEGIVIALGEAGLTRVFRESTQAATMLLIEITSLVEYLGDNLPAVGALLTATLGPRVFVAAIAGVASLSKAVVAAIRTITVAAATNPFGAAIIGATALVGYLNSIKGEVSAVGAAFKVFGDNAKTAWNNVKDYASTAIDLIERGINKVISAFTGASSSVQLTWLTAFDFITKSTDTFYNTMLGGIAALGAGFRALTTNAGILFDNLFGAAREKLSDFMQDMSGFLDKFGLGFDYSFYVHEGSKEYLSIADEVSKAYEGMANTVSTNTRFMADYIDRELKRAGDATSDWATDAGKAFASVVDDVKDLPPPLRDNTKALNEAAKAAKKFADQREEDYKKQLGIISDIQKETRALEDQIATFDKGKRAIEQLAIARLKEQVAVLKGFEGSERAIELLQLEIRERERALKAGFTLDALESGKKASEELAESVKRTHDEIERSLTDALMRGFENGKPFAKNLIDTIKNLGKTLVIRPLIEPIMSGLAGAISGSSAGGTGVGLFGGAKSIADIGNALSGGFVQGLSTSIGSIGSAFGISAMQNFALGMSGKGAVLGAGLMGPTTTGAGGAVAAGSAFASVAPYAAAALAAYSLISSFTNKGETRYGGGFHYDPTLDATRFGAGPSGGFGGGETLGAVNTLLKGQHDQIKGLIDALDIQNVEIASILGSFESSEKGRGGTSSGGQIIIDGKSFYFGSISETGDLEKGRGFGGTSGTSEEMFGNLTKEIYFSTLEAYQLLGDQMPAVIKNMLDGIDIRGLTAEQAQQAVEGISVTVSSVNALQSALSNLPFENLTNLTFDLTASLMQAAGGMDGLLTGLDSYYQNFFTEQERYENSLSTLTKQVKNLGYALPETRDEFRMLVESLDATNEANHEAIASLLGLSAAAAEVYAYQEQMAQQAIDTARDSSNAARDAAQRIIDTFKSVGDAVSSSFASITERITLDLLETDEQKYNYYKQQYDSLANQLTIATDAATVQTIVQQMNAVAGSAYGLIGEEERRGGKGQEFLQTLGYNQTQAEVQLTKIQDYTIKQQENSDRVINEMNKIMESSAKANKDAAEAILQASANIQAASENMARASVGGRGRRTEATV